MAVNYNMNRRQLLGRATIGVAGAAGILAGGPKADGTIPPGIDLGGLQAKLAYKPKILTPDEALIPGREMYKGKVVPWRSGIVDISLTRGLNKDNADDILGYAAACLNSKDKTHKQPRIQILIAYHPDNLNLAGSEAEYVKKFDYLPPLLEKHNLGVDGLMFIGPKSGAHMVSAYKDRRDLAEKYNIAAVNIIRRLNGDTVSGPGPLFEHGITGDVHIENAVDHIKRIADHAANYGITVCGEPLRAEETDAINTLDDIAGLKRLVGRENFKILWDTSHMYQVSPDLAHSAKRALIMGMGDGHGSRWMEWLHPKNRGRFEEDADDPVCNQLENVMMVLTVNGYDGSFHFEGPHGVFRGALGQGDPYDFEHAPDAIQDGLALSNAWASIAIMNKAKSNVEKRLAKRN